MDKFDDEKLWNELLTFKHNNMIAMKNLDNNLATESWDSLFHSGFFLALASLRLNRLGNDTNIANEIISTLQVILENGVTFRGFNSPGEYWSGHAMKKYYPIWKDEEVFGDVSRDQILGLTFGLFFIHTTVIESYREIHSLKKEIVKQLVEKLEKADYDLGTTYGNCKGFELSFRVFFNIIQSDAPLKKSDELKSFFRYVKWACLWLRMVDLRIPYFNNNLMTILLFLLFSSIKNHDSPELIENMIGSKNLRKIAKQYKKLINKLKKDNNLFFEICYHHATGNFIKIRNFKMELDRIFRKMPEKKIQDFIWQRNPKDWYDPQWGKNVHKNFYSPWHDYLLVYEMIQDMDLD